MDFHDLKQQGLSLCAIARQTGRDRKTVTKYLARGLKPNPGLVVQANWSPTWRISRSGLRGAPICPANVCFVISGSGAMRGAILV